jgi:ferredoxin-NADP reductase
VATLTGARWESATARTLVFDVPSWPGHRAGQHVDVKLTAEDGYSAQRSYSIASAPDSTVSGTIAPDSTAHDGTGRDGTGPGPVALELTVQRLPDGEVSPYLTDVLEPGDQVELRGPIGGWFVWGPSAGSPLQLIAGGSGIVPLMAMIRAAQPRAGQPPAVPLRLLYSARTPADVIYSGDLAQRARAPRFSLSYALTRPQRPAAPAPPPAGPSARVAGNRQDAIALRGSVTYGRISSDVVAAAAWGPQVKPAIFICGPSGFVEAAADLLIAAGHDPAAIKTERLGPTSELAVTIPATRDGLGERSELPGGTAGHSVGVVPPGGDARQLDALAGFASAELDHGPTDTRRNAANAREATERGLPGLAPRRRRRCWR